MDKIKIKISEFAYEILKKAFIECPEYSFIRFVYSKGCSKHLKIEIILDNAKENDITDIVDELPFLYEYDLADKVKEVIIIYRNYSLQIKAIPYEPIIKDYPSNCDNTSGCSGCSGCGKKD